MEDASGERRVRKMMMLVLETLALVVQFIGFEGSVGPSQSTIFGSAASISLSVIESVFSEWLSSVPFSTPVIVPASNPCFFSRSAMVSRLLNGWFQQDEVVHKWDQQDMER